ncbi:phosphoadenosine phosphosulfate reductase family protein [Streptomyces acidiscabies]|uniref:Phosphoadenosine phosphosulfate reductase family protein n=1 Tax=Streptomyces acidiscabies TaxID=42234 RepID=A0AAP6BKP5_9ACTN|nr:phosphoadenosine phosphosulfate reductase family protein [Streptomyces acidiscabies]MBP5937924.1 phosphoadenosine phosphosulfate reductase family protein [Streptomyces sp. LBUM 1476]MBZ3908925.1 phosphoadenosine phosphosulfate reductase family protein [Streptomyces acidiscabies]MDX2966569.1 phosphoadenosine phosphosulfate reductase family protein [Streptomyces acidiscabies]MDX3016668.1 phosphoadenosine phosphosulfate reductase family protein [Streptomyces acidiscabies]MDX3788424.1 phosphoad
MTDPVTQEKVRHVLGISGGKDSSALAIYMRDRVPEMEYFFCDTGAELPETYEYLNRLEAALGKPIERLNADRDFDHWMEVYQGTLPSPQMRWCTKNLKIKPLEEWVGDDKVISYVAIRADENRLGYVSTKPNIDAVFPFREDGVDKDGVMRILDEAGIGLPGYYEWRTRSGCYFCFFQRKHEWVGLKERHPDLYDKAVEYEDKVRFRHTAMKGRNYTWSQGESLPELIERKDEIEAKHEAALERAAKRIKPNRPLLEVLSDALDSDDDEAGCSVCHL